VGISALVLEKLNSLGLSRDAKYRQANTDTWYSFESDVEQALIISSNEAANRLILFLGFDEIAQKAEQKGLSNFAINRLMLNEGTLIDSPSFELLDKDGSPIFQDASTTSQEIKCFEVGEKAGNCATAADLVGILERIVQPGYFDESDIFKMTEDDRLWLQDVMSKTPKEAGFNQPDEFCRFLNPLYEKIGSRNGKLLSKCGIALFTHSYVDTSFLKTNEGEEFYVAFSVTPPWYISKEQATEWINNASDLIVSEL